MNQLILYVFAPLFGLAVGSFLNALIWRLKNNKPIGFIRSICPKCRKILSWHDLIPFFSFIFLLGKCRFCKKSISWQYPLVELSTALLFVSAVYIHGANLDNLFLILRDWFFIAVLIVVFIYDLKWDEILDKIILPTIILALAINLLLGHSWQNLFLAAFLGLVFFLFQHMVSKGKWIGGGDIRMGALMGFMLGWPNILVGLFLAYLLGALFSVPLLISGRKKLKSTLPLGTFLSMGTIIALFWGGQIIFWYLNFL